MNKMYERISVLSKIEDREMSQLVKKKSKLSQKSTNPELKESAQLNFAHFLRGA